MRAGRVKESYALVRGVSNSVGTVAVVGLFGDPRFSLWFGVGSRAVGEGELFYTAKQREWDIRFDEESDWRW